MYMLSVGSPIDMVEHLLNGSMHHEVLFYGQLGVHCLQEIKQNPFFQSYVLVRMPPNTVSSQKLLLYIFSHFG